MTPSTPPGEVALVSQPLELVLPLVAAPMPMFTPEAVTAGSVGPASAFRDGPPMAAPGMAARAVRPPLLTPAAPRLAASPALAAPARAVQRRVEADRAGGSTGSFAGGARAGVSSRPALPVVMAGTAMADAGPTDDAGRPIEALGTVQEQPATPRPALALGAMPAIQRTVTVEELSTSSAPAARSDADGAAPAGGAEPDIDRLADRVWQVVRRKIAIERERRHGLP
jgi:hypothetical protein